MYRGLMDMKGEIEQLRKTVKMVPQLKRQNQDLKQQLEEMQLELRNTKQALKTAETELRKSGKAESATRASENQQIKNAVTELEKRQR